MNTNISKNMLIARYRYGVCIHGYIAFVRIYNRALSDSEITHNYYFPNDPVRDGLVLWLHWDSIDIENGIWYDKSGYDNHGTIYGATLVDIIKSPTRILSPTRIIRLET